MHAHEDQAWVTFLLIIPHYSVVEQNQKRRMYTMQDSKIFNLFKKLALQMFDLSLFWVRYDIESCCD